MEPTDSHSQIMLALGEMKGQLSRGIEGVNHRLDTLNSSVAKHEIRLASQDILNAQMTMTQGQTVKELTVLEGSEKINNDFILRTQGSINTFKWLVGFIGIGNLVILLKVLGFINLYR